MPCSAQPWQGSARRQTRAHTDTHPFLQKRTDSNIPVPFGASTHCTPAAYSRISRRAKNNPHGVPPAQPFACVAGGNKATKSFSLTDAQFWVATAIVHNRFVKLVPNHFHIARSCSFLKMSTFSAYGSCSASSLTRYRHRHPHADRSIVALQDLSGVWPVPNQVTTASSFLLTQRCCTTWNCHPASFSSQHWRAHSECSLLSS